MGLEHYKILSTIAHHISADSENVFCTIVNILKNAEINQWK